MFLWTFCYSSLNFCPGCTISSKFCSTGQSRYNDHNSREAIRLPSGTAVSLPYSYLSRVGHWPAQLLVVIPLLTIRETFSGRSTCLRALYSLNNATIKRCHIPQDLLLIRFDVEQLSPTLPYQPRYVIWFLPVARHASRCILVPSPGISPIFVRRRPHSAVTLHSTRDNTPSTALSEFFLKYSLWSKTSASNRIGHTCKSLASRGARR